MPADNVVWGAAGAAAVVVIGAIFAGIRTILDTRHGHRMHEFQEIQSANDNMFKFLRSEVEDLRLRYHQVANEANACLLREAVMTSRISALEAEVKILKGGE